jgi:uncharacterized membrane protein
MRWNIAWLAAVVIVVAIVSLGSLSFMPEYGWMLLDPPTAGQFGDLVGGFLGPVLSLIGIFFVVVTLREQRSATTAERESEAIEAFENRYYQLVSMHRGNVAEMQVGHREKIISGRKVFVEILYEFQQALFIIRKAVAILDPTTPSLDQLQIAYYVVFFGIGSNSSPQMREALKSTGCRLTSEQLDFIEYELRAKRTLEPYWHFDGHQSRLGHYYRHLYQTISYVSAQTLAINKSEYTKTIRAQLSNHEQALLLVNSLTPIGWKWWTEGYMLDYQMVKNLPKGFVEEYCSFIPSELILEEKYFEWQEDTPKPQELDRFSLMED